MRLKNLLFGILTSGLVISCSSKEEVDMPEVISHDGDYMSVGINLPTTPSTRAANDNFDDGTPDEYKVSNGCLVLFVGTNENTAKFAAAYELKGFGANVENNGTSTDNITSTYKKSVKLDNFSCAENEDIYAFVMLNYSNVASVTADNGLEVTYNNAGNKATKELVRNGKTNASGFTEFYSSTQADFCDSRDGTKTNFFMCNAPLSTTPGGKTNPVTDDFKIITLVKLDKAKIFKTQAEAELSGNESGVVNVERGLAKATMAWTPEGFGEDSGVATKDNSDISFAFIGWKLDVTERFSYICRKTQQSDEWWQFNNTLANNYRFVGSVPIESGLYRTYWCIDPVYTYNLITTSSAPADYNNFVDKNVPLYCYENTFDVTHQNYRNTTRAIFQATLKFGDSTQGQTFYVLNGVESNIYLNLTDVESYSRKLILESDIIKSALNNALKENQQYTAKDVENIVKISFTRNASSGIREVSDITFDVAENSTMFNVPVLSDDNKNRLINQANLEYVIKEYVNGNTYYDLRFMHFASDSNEAPADLAPWQVNSEIVTTTVEAYPGEDAANNWLGRYGMVRNNWYDVTVTGVKRLGEPVIPDVTGSRGDTSDDNKENYISFRINILSWAKRTQTHAF